MRSSVGIFNLHRDGEVVVTSIFKLLPLDVVALSGCERDPCTNLGRSLVKPIVAPIYLTVEIRNHGCVWLDVGISIVRVL